jgi:hypothetical protein
MLSRVSTPVIRSLLPSSSIVPLATRTGC